MSTTAAEKAKAKSLCKAVRRHVDNLLLATTIAQLKREHVDKIQRKWLADNVCHVDQQWVRDGSEAERITEPSLTYLMSDGDAARYHAALNAIHLAEGFEEAAIGNCPALCAEYLQTQAEWVLIEAAKEFFPGVTNDVLLCGTKELGGLECRQKFIDLLIGLVVNSPGYESPLPLKANKGA